MKNKIIVNKFGGGIMIPEHINFAQEHIKEQLEKGYQPVVVVSALKGITDDLVSFLACQGSIDSLITKIRKKHLGMMKELPEFTEILQNLKEDLTVVARFGALDIVQDKVLSYGERLSCLFFSLFLQANGIEAKAIKAEDIPIVTDNVRLNANIDYSAAKKNIEKALEDISFVPVISGFTGKDSEGNITTLGRGGTDTTACFVGAALKADKVILWKDTEGVLSADPRIVPQAITVPYISYKEAKESGKIIHSKAIQYIEGHEVNMEIAYIKDYQKRTLVGPQDPQAKGVKIIGFKKALTLMIVTDEGMGEYGFLYGISQIFNEYEINMVLIRNTRDSLHIVVEDNNGNLEKSLKELKGKGYLVNCQPVNMVTLIGGLDWGTVSEFNDALIKICPQSQIGAFPYKDCVRLEAVVKTNEMEKVMLKFHKIFIEDNKKI